MNEICFEKSIYYCLKQFRNVIDYKIFGLDYSR